jgi:hypothetical protein
LLWLEGNPLPEGVAVNVGFLQNQQNQKGDRDAVVELLRLYISIGVKEKVPEPWRAIETRIETQGCHGNHSRSLCDLLQSHDERPTAKPLNAQTDFVTAKLRVEVINARGLPLLANAVCDPYVKLKYLHSLKQKTKIVSFKTKVRTLPLSAECHFALIDW